MSQQANSRSRRTAAQSSSSPANKTSRSSATLQAAQKRRRVDPNASTYVVVGAVVVLIGLAFAVGLAMTAPGPSQDERSLAIMIAPWVVFAGGLGITVYGFLHLGSSERSPNSRSKRQ